MTSDLRAQLQATLGATYRLDRELGGGGMSRVFVAEETSLGREVVVKVLPPELAQGANVERFRREVQMAARLQHPHIVPLLAAGEADGVLYYTMPLVRGESLRARLAREGALPVADAVGILRDVASALAHAHASGVVHRDIKPENVLLSGTEALVTDFGISRAVSEASGGTSGGLTGTGIALGTPAYMAPEQVVADPNVDHRADLYALGVMAYEMLAGSAPFAGRTAQALLAAHVTDDPEPLVRRRAAVPPLLAELVMRCLAKQPADRPQSAAEVTRTLEAVATTPVGGMTHGVTHGMTGALAPGGAPPGTAPRGRRLTSGLAAGVLVLAAIVAGGSWLLRGRGAAAVDRNVIAVLPFRVVGGDAELRTMREGMPDLVAAKLTGRLHTLDVRTVLAAWRRAGGGDASDLPREESVALARGLGAGAVLVGDILAAGGELTLNGSLLPVTGGDDRRATVKGAATALPLLVDSLVAKLLALDAGEGDERVASLAGVPLAALQAYLEGRAHERGGRYGQATGAYARALEADSTLALAALRLWMVSSNWTSDARGAQGLATAVRHVGRLGARDRLALGTIDDPARPRSCGETFRSREQAVGIAPDVPDLWYLLGETLMHCGAAMGVPDEMSRALGAFNRALALDSSYTPAYEHLPAIYWWLEDTLNVRRSIEAARVDTTSETWPFLAYFFGAGGLTAREAVEHLARGGRGTARSVIGVSMYDGRSMPEAEELLTRLRGSAVTSADRRQVAALERTVALNRGQPARAAEAARALSLGPASALLAATFWDADSAEVPAARRAAAAALARGVTADTSELGDWTSTVFALAASELARDDTTHATRAVVQLRAVRPAPGQPEWRVARAGRLALLLDAVHAQRAGRANAGVTLAAADSMLREAPGGTYVESAGNLLVSAAWERAGDLPRAHAAARRVRASLQPVPYHSTYLREQGRLAARLGRDDEALAAYGKYLRLRAVAEPAFAAHLASVRGEVARLEAKRSR